MRSLLAVCLLGLVLICVGPRATGEVIDSDKGIAESPGEVAPATTDPDAAELQGLVYAYGTKLAGPYVFTESEDGKTLYVNGLIYVGPGEGPPPDITVTVTVRSQHELNVRAADQATRGAEYEDRLEILASVYRSSPLVRSVRKFSQGVYVTWASYPDDEEEIILPREESQFDLEAYMQGLVAEFHRIVESGGMVVFGKNYHIYVPRVRSAKTVHQIRLVEDGAPRESLDVMNTALQNKRFIEDLYRLNQGPMEEE